MLICVLGRNPSLGLAELEAILGPEKVKPLGNGLALVKDSIELPHRDLGGIIKTGELIAELPNSPKWTELSDAVQKEVSKYIIEKSGQSGHKIALGISIYGLKAGVKQVEKLSFDIKTKLKAAGISSHVVVGKENALNSAQVIYNKLLGEFGFEFLLAASAETLYLAKSISVQDIDRYAKRDYGRPKRDTKTGMLPPKLAQIMLNLAKADKGNTVFDPFCGTGVVLMEAALKGCKVLGSDVNQKMIDYTRENLQWLEKEYDTKVQLEKLTCADSNTTKWRNKFDRVVSEIYLGPPLDHLPKEESLRSIAYNANVFLNNFLANLRPQLDEKSRCCIAVPVWKTPDGFLHLPVVRALESLGYHRVKFTHANFNQLLYHRPDQIVGRELLVLTPK